MPLPRFKPTSLSIALCGLLLANPGWAGGLMLYEVGQEGAGLANAGAAVLASDPSILMNNPAGLGALPGTQVNLNGQLILGDVNFSRDATNQFAGNEGGNLLQALPGSSLFISHQLDERASIGFGMYGNFGLTADYDDDWAGRYFTQESALIGMSLQPTFAYRISDALSIGFGPHLMYGYYRTEAAINNNLLGVTGREDGQLEYEDTDFGLGFNLGLLYHLDARTAIGLAYTSKVDLQFDDRPQLDDISNPQIGMVLERAKVSLDFSVPQTLLLSASHQLDEQWTLLGSLGWQDWSDFGEVGLEVDANLLGVGTTVKRNYQDTWHASIGTQYQASRQLRLNLGVGYDSSMVEDADRTVDNPTDASWRLATGLNYALAENLDMHLTYTLIWMGDMAVEQTKARSGMRLSGTYQDAMLHILGGGAVWRF